MINVLQLTRELKQCPSIPAVSQVRLRHYRGASDIPIWLELRRRAFAKQKVGVRDWDEADFQREMLQKRWWRPQAMWIAEAEPLMMPAEPIGSVTLARRGDPPDDKPVVHWLLVVPSHRRRGVARLLMAALEAAVWNAGGRQVWLETHAGWKEAVSLYQSLGYRPANEPAE